MCCRKNGLYHWNKTVRIDSNGRIRPRQMGQGDRREKCGYFIHWQNQQIQAATFARLHRKMQVKRTHCKSWVFNLTDVDHLYVNHLFVMLLLRVLFFHSVCFFHSLSPAIVFARVFLSIFVFIQLFCVSFFHVFKMALWLFASVATFVRFAETNATTCKKNASN